VKFVPSKEGLRRTGNVYCHDKQINEFVKQKEKARLD